MTSNIQDTLINWYAENHRDLPWRHEPTPYQVWLSEVILQQTRVNQGMDYYLRFVERWSSVTDLAKASEEEVLKMWQGLGYYSRARNLHKCARQVVEQYEGQFPADFEQLKQLQGIGSYTAAAIASIAFNLPHAVVDGNVYRVLSRLFDITWPPQPSHDGVWCLALHTQESQLPALPAASPMFVPHPSNRDAAPSETAKGQGQHKIFQLFGYQNKRQCLPAQAQRQ